MPGFDRTGPLGQGTMTGRGLGPCGGGFRGRAYGSGFGRARGFGFVPTPPSVPAQPTEEQKSQFLENEAKAIEEEQKALKQELETVKKRLEELKNKK